MKRDEYVNRYGQKSQAISVQRDSLPVGSVKKGLGTVIRCEGGGEMIQRADEGEMTFANPFNQLIHPKSANLCYD